MFNVKRGKSQKKRALRARGQQRVGSRHVTRLSWGDTDHLATHKACARWSESLGTCPFGTPAPGTKMEMGISSSLTRRRSARRARVPHACHVAPRPQARPVGPFVLPGPLVDCPAPFVGRGPGESLAHKRHQRTDGSTRGPPRSSPMQSCGLQVCP